MGRRTTPRRRQLAVPPTVLGPLLACGLALLATRVHAQAQPAAPENLDPTAARSFTLPKAVALTSRAPLSGSVVASTLEGRRTGTELRLPLTAAGIADVQQNFRVVAGGARVETLASKPFVNLPERGTSVLSSRDAPKIAAQSNIRVGEKTPLPWMVVDTKPSVAAAEQPQVRTARPYLGLARAIRWDEASDYHIAQFQLGIDAESGGAGKLEEPVVATLSVSCDDVRPAKVTLDAIGPAGERVLQVRCARTAKKDPATQTLKVRLADAELPYPFTIPHVLGAPRLTSSATRVTGFGVGTVFLTVRNVEEDDTPAPVAQETSVRLEADGASIDPSVVTIPRGASEATIEVRSRSIGKVQIRAGAAEFHSDPIAIDFGFPIAFLLVTLIGGAAGGYLSSLRANAKTPRRKSRLVQNIVEGAIVGVVVVVAVLLLPTVAAIPTWARASAVGWFLTSALAGFTGSDLLERLANRVFGKRSEEERPNTTPA